MTSVKLFSDFVPESVEEGSVRNLDNGAKIVYLNHGSDRSPVILQTATLRTIKGIEDNNFGDGPTKYTMELALAPEDAEYQKLAAFDHRIVDIASTSKQKWLKTKNGSTPNRALLEELYTPTLRIPRDKETGQVSDRWPPTFRVTIPQRRDTGGFDIEVWDSSKNKVDINEFITSGQSRNAHITVIVRCTGIWVGGGKFGTSWKAQQILVHTAGRASTLNSFAFVNPERLIDPPALGGASGSGSGGGGFTAPPPPVPAATATATAPAAAKTQAEDDDDEYIDDSD
nr:hypothetical protein TetV2_00363 [Oceanusvirus sp.]